MNDTPYAWPRETAQPNADNLLHWCQEDSNIALDFHGDPTAAKLAVVSDGNHHMALQAVAAQFLADFPEVADVFYVTLPPRLVQRIVRDGGIQLANLRLTINADVVLSPRPVLDDLASSGLVSQISPFMKNRGCVLLIRKINPKAVTGIADLFRPDITLFISHPINEKVSHQGYRTTLLNLAKAQRLDSNRLAQCIDQCGESTVYGTQIHHREAPVALLRNRCDVAIVYYHLALRYTRIFPDQFTFIPLGGTIDNPMPDTNNIASEVYMAIATGAGQWGTTFRDYLVSDSAAEIYKHHGLLRS